MADQPWCRPVMGPDHDRAKRDTNPFLRTPGVSIPDGRVTSISGFPE